MPLPTDDVACLPDTPGVYVFWGEHSTLPLYIGKSITLRTRVLSHLRDPSEVAMMAQAQRVTVCQTAGEIGALLLEAHLIKQAQPLHNIKLRRRRSLFAWRLEATAAGLVPVLADSLSTDFAQTDGLHGLYSSPRAAHEALRALATEARLCLSTLGLEAAGPRGCFGRQIRRCDGVCVGAQARTEHDARLREHLAGQTVARWPFGTAVDLIEAQGDWVTAHRLDRWCYLGSRTLAGGPPPHPLHRDAHTLCPGLAPAPPGRSATHPPFDLDTYKILVGPLLNGRATVQALEAAPLGHSPD